MESIFVCDRGRERDRDRERDRGRERDPLQGIWLTWLPFLREVGYRKRIQTVMEWLALPPAERCKFHFHPPSCDVQYMQLSTNVKNQHSQKIPKIHSANTKSQLMPASKFILYLSVHLIQVP